MSTPEAAVRMYPTMATPAPASAPTPAGLVKREIDMAVNMYPTMNKPAGYSEPAPEGANLKKADGQTDADSAGTVLPPVDPAQPAPTPLTAETIEQAIASKDPAQIAAIETAVAAAIESGRSAEVMAARKLEGSRPYMTSLIETMGPSTLPGTAALHQEIAHISADVGLSPEDLRSLVPMARRYAVKAPDEVTVATWRGLVTDQERALAATELQRDPRIPALLKVWNISDSPQLLRALARKAQSRRA